MERLYWNTVKFNNQPMYLVANRRGIKFISDPMAGISQIYDFYRHQPFEFQYGEAITSPYVKWLANYLDGDQMDNRGVPLDIQGCGDRLDHQVWRMVRKIPYGEVRTVQQLAKLLQISDQRTVQALRRNPVLILIPTHRVLVNSRKLGQFRENLGMKSQLIEIETIMRNVEN